LGVYHGLRRRHRQSYLDEFVFNRRRTRHAVFRSLLGIAAVRGPLTYNMLIAPEAQAVSRLPHNQGIAGCCVADLRRPRTAIEPASGETSLKRVRRAYRSLTSRHGLLRLIRAGGVGLIVGIGMAIFLPFVD